ncbi:MAG TPA: ribosome small subunit-dependent GTPase A [Gaiellaceae bacterium]|nr:ribosome small subunit-dependent GTPase A [Gaiellaceae bacterium]
MPELAALGWDDAWETAFEPYRRQGLAPARVAVPHRAAYDVLTADGEARARLPGRLRHEARGRTELPTVGDWVALEARDGSLPAIRAVLPRRTAFVRRLAPEGGRPGREQVVAANVDVMFVAASLGEELDPRRLERYLALVRQGGARPVLLLTKADLHERPERAEAEARALVSDVPVHAVSARTGRGLDALRSYLPPGVTGALLGPSGVGKSTLVNALVGEEVVATGEAGRDGVGRHVTTRRELVLLPDGGLLIDNPGMRELHLTADREALAQTFSDIAELAAGCRFSDCRHEAEPGCAVRQALAEGRLAPERWRIYRALARELAEDEARARRRRSPRGRR